MSYGLRQKTKFALYFFGAKVSVKTMSSSHTIPGFGWLLACAMGQASCNYLAWYIVTKIYSKCHTLQFSICLQIHWCVENQYILYSPHSLFPYDNPLTISDLLILFLGDTNSGNSQSCLSFVRLVPLNSNEFLNAIAKKLFGTYLEIMHSLFSQKPMHKGMAVTLVELWSLIKFIYLTFYLEWNNETHPKLNFTCLWSAVCWGHFDMNWGCSYRSLSCHALLCCINLCLFVHL